MKLKINKACDLNSISVLPPQARRSNHLSHGPQTSQLRSQQSQQSFSQGLSSQHGMFSQISQSSLDDVLTNDQRFGSQERENSVKKNCLPPTSHTREDSQMGLSRSSTNLMRKWNSASLPDYRSQNSEELEHRIGIIETSLTRFGMVLDSLQSDVMQVNKGTKEVLLETEGIRQKLVLQDNSLQLMNKGQEDIKASLDGGFKSISELLSKQIYQDKLEEIFSVLSALLEKIEASIQKSQNEIRNSFTKEMQTIACSLMIPDQKDHTLSIVPTKVTSCSTNPQGKQLSLVNSARPPMVCEQATVVPKAKTGGWKAVKLEKATFTNRASNKVQKQKGVSSIHKVQERDCRIIIESDEEIDGGFSCLLKENETDFGNYLNEEIKEETKRMLRKARRRKRRCCDTIIIN
ncbi:hypothetical protein UlMin_022458 [Ulmus minor]